jgi:hypothetical protein
MAKGYKKDRASYFYLFRRSVNYSFSQRIIGRLAHKRRLVQGISYLEQLANQCRQ